MRDDVARFDAMRDRVKQALALAEQLYGVKIAPSVSFNLRGRVAGWAGCKICMGQRQYSLRFNCELIQGKHFDDMLCNTVPHEVAHLVCYARPDLGRGHDAGWKRVCLALGGNGQRCHSYDVVVKGRWDYMTDRGNKVSVTKRHHEAVQRGSVLRFKRGLGTIDRYSPCAPSGQPIPQVGPNGPRPTNIPGAWPVNVSVAPPTAPVVQPVAAPTMLVPAGITVERVLPKEIAGSWASRVRLLIGEAKAEGRDAKSVVEAAVSLGMLRTSAVNCVKANWPKV
jgi:SprT protein